MQAVARRGLVEVDKATPLVFRFVRRCPGFTKWTDDGGCIFEASKKHLEMWREMFPDVTIEDKDGSIAKLYVEKIVIGEHEYLTETVGQPWQHQRRAHNIMMSRPYYGFFHDMGTGKSFTMIKGMAELFTRGLIDRALIISTSRGRPQFIEEQVKMWMPQGIRYRIGEYPAKKTDTLFLYPSKNLLVAVATPGAFQSKNQTKMIREFCKGGKTAIFVDESQNFKGWSSRRVDNLLTLVPFSTHRFLFSGEPEPKGYEDLFAQFYFMDPNILGHNSMKSFEQYFCVKGGYEFKEIVDYIHTDELAELIAPHCEYIKITDCMDMPKQAWHEARFKPTDRQVELYADLKRDYVVCVERALNEREVEIVARHCKNAASRYTAMAQVACGWFYADLKDVDSPREVVHITDERAIFTIEELVGSAEKCLVWARFYEDLDQIKRVTADLGIDAVEFSGRLPKGQAEKNKIRFQTDDKCRIFYGTTSSGGEALNLQVANRSIYYSNSFNWGHRIQSERRTWRAGQTKACSYWDVIGFPIDRVIRNNALEKKDLSAQLQIATGLAALIPQL
jgi:SNF2-related domain